MAIDKEQNSPLRRAQITMLEMLLVVDNICKTEEIPYWITDGTLLGSERHKGFIPWDDDADIGMLRKDYTRFKKVVESKLPKKFKLETETVHTHGKHNWLKILYLEDFDWIDWHGIKRRGISIDIFPYDFVNAPNKMSMKEKIVHRIASIKYPSEANNMKNKLRRVINKLQLQDVYSQINPKSDYVTYGIETPYFGWAYYNIHDIFPLKEGIFENERFKVPANPKHYLTTLYGEDYMEIPEEHKRQSHMTNLTLIKE
ncbi:LicD family protein [Paenibacillus sp. BSR1-1]|uniref:LicD family protein n=1 Tax=Paenibacillus sp. BSR1-1 TaxID=3020845 RepID=UPI0025B02C19|nr:LicD family protein [Paenibacillus sp. BSR1-1]MDN3019005.1 LicD family protein [Paenibacillus sp. BSR1-1]